MTSSADLPWEISVHQTQQLLQSGDIVLIDCREPAEYLVAKIEGSVLVPMSEFGQRLDEVDAHRDCHIVIHCHHGGRSLKVAQALRSRGFSQVQSMAGGIDVWSQEIDSQIPRY